MKTTLKRSAYTQHVLNVDSRWGKKERREMGFRFNGVGRPFFISRKKDKHGGKQNVFRKFPLLSFLVCRYLLPVLINLRSCRGKKIDIVRPSKANNLFLLLHFYNALVCLEALRAKEEIKFGSFGNVWWRGSFLWHWECGKSINSITDFEEILMGFFKERKWSFDKWLWRVYVEIFLILQIVKFALQSFCFLFIRPWEKLDCKIFFEEFRRILWNKWYI